ncbi:MAG: ABC transporter ATP-binding protein, partial [Cyclobacteriaceae bacterium]|nr:ABC transporter ATP-binding protein [Cyclobacteriaceae bacterium]
MLDAFKFKTKGLEDFWALNEVSFSVNQGESIGIIGRNGAGKSTLLKILSKITPPTTGNITTRGRIASLLEVGTGFHPELTGRENIFFNGSLLGMKRKEIEAKFDERVDFSGVEKFLDTQLKHFSSGMQLRLAFAVAAFLEPEILIIDEVLAVGDAEFQKKCMGKMEDVSKSGRTILFVSHNMAAVSTLCKRGILLHEGRLIANGDVNVVLNQYQQQYSKIVGNSWK